MFYLIVFVRSPSQASQHPGAEEPATPPTESITTAATPQSEIEERKITKTDNDTENNLLISFIVLACVMVIGIVAIIIFIIFKFRKTGKISAAEGDQADVGQEGTERSVDTPTSRPGTGKSIYSVNTVVL